jgi:predicted P-loop ATPase
MAESALFQEAQALGLENAEIQATIRSGIDAGISEFSNIKIMPKAPNQLGFAPFLDSNGNLKICIQNALFLLSSENIKFSKNEFSQEFLIDGIPLQDEDLIRFSIFMEQKTKGRRWPEDLIDKSIKYLCSKRSFHPIKSEFEKVSWDEIPRIDAFFEDIFSIQDPEYPAIARAFFSQLIRRIYEPGSKADCVLLLIGPQGIGKSTFCRKLAIQETWYRDAIVGNLGSKDACLALRGKWIIELSELAALRKSAMEKIKNYLSIDIDQYRLPYARNEIAQPRTCVFIGTTNEELPLADHTGARRFWPIHLKTKPRLDLLEENLQQYYAEALKIYKSGRIFWHDPSRDLQESAYAQDSWEDILEEFLEGREITSILEISDLALKIDPSDLDKSTQTRIGTCLNRLGWHRERIWKGKERGQSVYKKRT